MLGNHVGPGAHVRDCGMNRDLLGKRVVDDLLGLTDDIVEVGLTLKAFGVNLIDIFGT